MLTKPELLVPVGSIESFHAAREAGADAVYLGLKKFNARGRAKKPYVPSITGTLCIVAKKHQLKVYITLNTVVKNAELAELLEVLQFYIANKSGCNHNSGLGCLLNRKKIFPDSHTSCQHTNGKP